MLQLRHAALAENDSACHLVLMFFLKRRDTIINQPVCHLLRLRFYALLGTAVSDIIKA